MSDSTHRAAKRTYLLRLARQLNRIQGVLDKRGALNSEFADVQARPLSQKALELLRMAGEPWVGPRELALLELLRAALEAATEPPQAALNMLDVCDRLVLNGRPLAAYTTLIGFADDAKSPAWHALQEAASVELGFLCVVRMAAGSE